MKKGKIIAVLFDDHLIEHKTSTKGHDARFWVRGKVKCARGKYLTIETWEPVPHDEHNAETARILKSAILKWYYLRRE